VRRYIGLIALVVVFAVLLIIVLVTAPQSPSATATVAVTPTLTAEQQKLNIITLGKDEQPTKLLISQTNPAKAGTYIYEGAKWRLENQPQAELDSSQVAGAIGQLGQFKGNQVINENPTEANLKEFGLDNPSLKLELTGSAGTRSLLIGNINTVTNIYYVKLSDKPTVWSAPPSLINAFKSWLDSPPLAPPTPTPLPTLPVTPTLDPTAAATATANATLTPAAGTTPTSAATTAPTTAVSTPTVTVTPTPRP
jgi:hypothetical protein